MAFRSAIISTCHCGMSSKYLFTVKSYLETVTSLPIVGFAALYGVLHLLAAHRYSKTFGAGMAR